MLTDNNTSKKYDDLSQELCTSETNLMGTAFNERNEWPVREEWYNIYHRQVVRPNNDMN